MSRTRTQQFRTQQFRTHHHKGNLQCAFCKEEGHTIDKCQVLATTECKYCHGTGHTARRCLKLSQKAYNQRQDSMDRANQRTNTLNTGGFVTAKGTFRRRPRNNSNATVPTTNRFTGFNQEEKSPEPTKVSSFEPKKSKRLSLHGSWLTPIDILVNNGEALREIPKPKNFVKKSSTKKMSWADMADDDSDSDDEDVFLC